MLACQLALTSVNFDDTYNNSIRFNSRTEQEQYFKVDDLFRNATKVNLNVDSLIRTTLTYVSNSNDLSSLMNYNYCIVKDTNMDHSMRYYYYFIKESRFNNDRQVQLRVELDVLNTYLLDVTFDDCLIERAHLNRFRTNPNNKDYVIFDWGKDSKLYQREPITPSAKYLTNRRTPFYVYNTGDDANVGMNKWLQDNGSVWCYIFLAIKDDGYSGLNDGNSSPAYKLPFYYLFNKDIVVGNLFNYQPYICLCYPLKNTKRLQINRNGTQYDIDSEAIEKFLENNGGYANVLSMKLSSLPPFVPSDYTNDYSIDSKGNLLLKTVNGDAHYHNLRLYSVDGASNKGVIVYRMQDLETNYITGAVLHDDISFSKAKIKQSRSVKYNPKLYGSDYYDLRLTNGVNAYDYDLSKLAPTLAGIEVDFTEIISPDVTKQYLRIRPDTDSLYSQHIADNYSGLVSSLDYSVPYSKNNLDVYLANNKNFFLQTVTNTGVATGGMVGGAVAGIVAGMNPVGLAIGATVATAGIIGNIISKGTQVDNMRKAPEQLASANSNGAFNVAVTGIKTYVETYETSENEKIIFDDYMHLYGFTYDRIDNISNVINIRKNFNYVKAKVETIKSEKPLSNEVRDRIKQIFNNGITFWNVTDKLFDHNVPNYERWLDS